jgi:hypothetical protein
MLTIDTKIQVEKDFKEIVDKKYSGDATKALMSFIEHERAKELSWDKKFQFHLNRLRQSVKKMGGITDDQIEAAIKKYREKKRNSADQA